MSVHSILYLTLAAATIGSASACADPARSDPHEIAASPVPVARELVPASELAPMSEVEPSPDTASTATLSAAAIPTPAHQNALTVVGQLATTQALIVTLLVAPFATTQADDPSTARDSRVPR
jgi:hypothetical protein